MSQSRIFQLECGVMNYDWGQTGEKSLVANLSGLEKIEKSKPYAELWMGIHPNCPSKVKTGDGAFLADALKSDPTLLGDYTYHRWGELPFLLKILSVAKPLSIQAHPDKTLAGRLYLEDSHHYPDDNHKPEIAVALSGLNVLYGLDRGLTVQKALEQFSFLSEYFVEYFSKERKSRTSAVNSAGALLKILLTLPIEQIESILKKAVEYLEKKQANLSPNVSLFLAQYPDYPLDIGLIFLLFMNYLNIKPGDAIFLGPLQLHAYLFGDLAECMANSDNVIRAGMTNKFKDLSMLPQVIDRQRESDELYCRKITDEWTIRYQTPAEEFELHKIDLPRGRFLKYQNPDVPEIIIVLSGNGKLESIYGNFELKQGTILYIGAKCGYSLSALKKMAMIRGTVPIPNAK